MNDNVLVCCTVLMCCIPANLCNMNVHVLTCFTVLTCCIPASLQYVMRMYLYVLQYRQGLCLLTLTKL